MINVISIVYSSVRYNCSIFILTVKGNGFIRYSNYYEMMKYTKSNSVLNRKIRLSIITAIIFVVLVSSILLLSQPNYKPSYAFAQTRGNTALSLANLIKQGQPHQGNASSSCHSNRF